MAATHQEDEIIGKAYDSRLMRRLIEYLRPYWRMTLFALVTTLLYGILQAIPAYLMKVEVDRYLDPDARPAPSRLPREFSEPRPHGGHCPDCFRALPPHRSRQLPAGVLAVVRHATGGAEGDVRPAQADLPPLAAAGNGLFRSQPRGPPGNAGDDRRGCAERPLLLRGGGDLRGFLHPPEHHGGDAVCELEAGVADLLRAAGHRDRYRRRSGGRCAILTGAFERRLRASTPICRNT